MFGHSAAAIDFADAIMELIREGVSVEFHATKDRDKIGVRLVHDGFIASSECGKALDSLRAARKELAGMHADREARDGR